MKGTKKLFEKGEMLPMSVRAKLKRCQRKEQSRDKVPERRSGENTNEPTVHGTCECVDCCIKGREVYSVKNELAVTPTKLL